MSNTPVKKKKPREITIKVFFDWEECEDVCAELMLEDGIELKRKGVSYEIVKDNYQVMPPIDKTTLK